MFGLSPLSLVAIALIAIMLFGSDLPDVARKIGGRYREFRRALGDVQQQFREIERETTKALTVDERSTASRAAEPEDEPEEPQAPKFTPPS